MHQIDYELGLASEEEDWDNAGGAAAAWTARALCMTGCRGKHFCCGNKVKAKRKACDGGCDAKYRAKLAAAMPPPPPPPPPPTPPKPPPPKDTWTQDLTDTAISIGRANLQTPSNGATEKKEGLSTGAMIGIGVGVMALLMIGGFMIMRKK